MTRAEAEKFISKKNAVLRLNCVSYIIKTEDEPPKIVYCKLAEVMQAGEEPITADTPESLLASIQEANKKHYISNIDYINKCISFE